MHSRAWLVVLAVACACRKNEEHGANEPLPVGVEVCGGKRVSIMSDPAHCSGCGKECRNPHGSVKCEKYTCVSVCAPGWGACDPGVEGCTTNLQTNPKSCGGCGLSCLGAPCIAGVCGEAPRVVARDVANSSITAVDGTYVYLDRNGEKPNWWRVRRADGKAEQRDGIKQFAPAAFDGKHLYGCKFSKEQSCQLAKREGDGAETTEIVLKPSPRAVAVRDDTVYWARYLPQPVTPGYDNHSGPYYDIVAVDLKTKAETVVAARETAVERIAVDGDFVFWTFAPFRGTAGVRRAPRKGGEASLLAEIRSPVSLALRGSTLFVSSRNGLYRTSTSGAAPELVVVGASGPKDDAVPGIAVRDQEVFWTVTPNGYGFAATILTSSLP